MAPVSVWHLIQSPPVPLTASELSRSCIAFRHLGTAVDEEAGEGHLRRGATVWGTEFAGMLIGVAFEWAETPDRIVALADPMRILSNVDLTQDNGESLDEARRIVQLNNLVHTLDWQAAPRALRR